MIATSASFSHNEGSGAAVVNADGMIVGRLDARDPVDPFLKSEVFACARPMLNTTSSAVNGVPSWKRTPWRSSNCQWVGSRIFQASASCGTIARLESMSSSAS